MRYASGGIEIARVKAADSRKSGTNLQRKFDRHTPRDNSRVCPVARRINLESLDAAVWDRLFATNLRGPYLLARSAAPHLKASGSGRIVNIASVAGLQPGGSSIGYATSKAGLIHLTRCLAVALAPHVSVNCVAPGLMDGTRMTSRLRPEQVEGALQRAVLKRAASVEDVADQVLAFCKSDSVTGQTVNIDAGVFFH